MLENFIYAEDKRTFENALKNGEVCDEAIALIEDTKLLWNHGTYFDFNQNKFDWSVLGDLNLEDEFDLEITADDVTGRKTTTTIYYTVLVNGSVKTTGTAISDTFPQNTSEIYPIERTITYTLGNVTATTYITQGVWVKQDYTISLNGLWLNSSKPNPNSTLYDGVYESFSNKGVHNKAAIMYIDIVGYTSFDLYIRSYAEGNYDYVMVSLLDKTITNVTSYSDTTLVKAHTRGKQNSGTSLSSYSLVSFTGIDGGQHRITIVYRKDNSASSGDDRGYILIKK